MTGKEKTLYFSRQEREKAKAERKEAAKNHEENKKKRKLAEHDDPQEPQELQEAQTEPNRMDIDEDRRKDVLERIMMQMRDQSISTAMDRRALVDIMEERAEEQRQVQSELLEQIAAQRDETATLRICVGVMANNIFALTQEISLMRQEVYTNKDLTHKQLSLVTENHPDAAQSMDKMRQQWANKVIPIDLSRFWPDTETAGTVLSALQAVSDTVQAGSDNSRTE